MPPKILILVAVAASGWWSFPTILLGGFGFSLAALALALRSQAREAETSRRIERGEPFQLDPTVPDLSKDEVKKGGAETGN